MADIWYGERAAIDPTTVRPMNNVDVQFYAPTDTAFTAPLTVKDSSGVATTSVHVQNYILPGFYGPDTGCVARSGSWITPLVGDSGAAALAQAEAAVASATSAVSQVTGVSSTLGVVARSLGSYATSNQLNGTADATSALQDCVDDLPNGGRIVSPPGSILYFDGTAQVDLSGTDGITFDLSGSTIKKGSTGSYVIFLARGALGYGSTVRNLTIENGYFLGTFATGAETPMCVLTANHAQNVIIRNCEFVGCATQSHHTFDLGGCDNVIFEDCVWRGFKPTSGSNPRTEAVNVDVSVNGSGADVPPWLDGLASRNIHMNRCQFLPWTESSTTYPSPNPMGSHLAREGQLFENISATNILIVDPVVDPATDSISAENPELHGLFHFPGVKNLRIQARVVATNGLGSTRVVQVQSASTGSQASTDPNVGGQGAFATANRSQNIDIDLQVEGLKGTASPTLNPQVLISGTSTAPVRNVNIKLSSDGCSSNAVYARYADDISVQLVRCDAADVAFRATNTNRANLRGNISQTRLLFAGTNAVDTTITQVNATHTTTQPSLMSGVTGSKIVASGISGTGYSYIYSVAPATHAEAAYLGFTGVVTPP